jgi:hypothetical protein
MKKNFKNVAFILGMIAISTTAMTSCGAAEKAKDAAVENADAAKEKIKEVAPDAVPEAAIDNTVDKVVDMIDGDTTAKCGEDKCGDEIIEKVENTATEVKEDVVKAVEAH